MWRRNMMNTNRITGLLPVACCCHQRLTEIWRKAPVGGMYLRCKYNLTYKTTPD